MRYYLGDRCMRILFVGDVVGRPGRNAVRDIVPSLVQDNAVDTVIVNGENSAGGSGITAATAAELFKYGAQVITLGDHVWDQRETAGLLEKEPRLLRPANYPAGAPGSGWNIFEVRGVCPAIGVINLLGRTFMKPVDDPFQVVVSIVGELHKQTPVIFIDFHAEATSEKIAMGRFLDGKVSAVIGTHTHVQTADEEIFPGGTAFLCDAGFTGAHESVIGRNIEAVVKGFTTGMPQRFEVASNDVRLNGVIVTVDNETGRAISIERVSRKWVDNETRN